MLISVYILFLIVLFIIPLKMAKKNTYGEHDDITIAIFFGLIVAVISLILVLVGGSASSGSGKVLAIIPPIIWFAGLIVGYINSNR